MSGKTFPPLLTYDMAAECYAFSTARGESVGTGVYSQFNISPYCGDCEEHVRECRQKLVQTLEIGDSRLLLPHQTHGTRYLWVDETFFESSVAERRRNLDGVDALLTKLPGVCVGVSTADCVPVLLYAGDGPCVGAVHAGWRGTVGRILSGVVDSMLERNIRAGSICAVIGPCISLEAFEVGDEVYDAFMQAGFPPRIAQRFSKKEGVSRWHLDLVAANVLQLLEKGIPASQIQQAGICTYSSSEYFFSARKLGVACGRIFNGVMLRGSLAAQSLP